MLAASWKILGIAWNLYGWSQHVAGHSLYNDNLAHGWQRPSYVQGHWLGVLTLAKDRCVSDSELPVKEILIKAVRKGPSFLLLLVIFVGQLFRSYDQNGVLAHFTHGLWTFCYFWASCMHGLSSSSCHLCLEIKIIIFKIYLCPFPPFLVRVPLLSIVARQASSRCYRGRQLIT